MKKFVAVCMLLSGCTGGYLSEYAVSRAYIACQTQGGLVAVKSIMANQGALYDSYKAICKDGTVVEWSGKRE